MRIGFSTSVIQRGKTGIAQYVFALLRAFDELKTPHEFRLFVLEEDRPLFSGLTNRFEIIPVPEKYRPAVKNILWHQTILPGLASKLNLDLIHVPSYRRLLWRSPCPRVATIHDLAPFHVSRKYDPARMLYGKVVVKQLARRQNQIIAISQNTARDIEHFFGIPQSELTVIHNGLEHSRFFPDSKNNARAFATQRFNLNQPFFLYVARLEHPAKNHVRLIEAFEAFKQRTGSTWLLAFGGSDWHGAEQIHARIKSSPYSADIRPLGFVKDLELPDLYRAAEVFVYPSLYEGFGLPPIEAMACGTPVISSTRGSLGEVIGNAAEIVEPEQVASITKALERVASDPSVRGELVRAGLARAALFNWQNTARQVLEVYQRAA